MIEMTRHNLRMSILRVRDERNLMDEHAVDLPSCITLNPEDLDLLRMDPTYEEQDTLQSSLEGFGDIFMGRPLWTSPEIPRGGFELQWPQELHTTD